MKKRNQMRYRILLIGLLGLFNTESCNRNEPTPVPECCYDCSCHYPCDDNEYFTYPYTDTLYLSDSFLSYWYFPVGSWWVYKRLDTTADVYDTARVVDQDRGIACNCKLLGDVCRERAMQEINHSFHFTMEEQTPERSISVNMDTELKIDWVFAHGGTSLLGGGGAPHFTYPFLAAKESGQYTMWYEPKSSFSTSLQTFQNPVTYHYQNPRVPADSVIRKTNVLVKDVGLVYFYDRDLSEWELTDYNIAKP